MSTPLGTHGVREPLPYPHSTPEGKVSPCQLPETRDIRGIAGELNCPGCWAWILAVAVDDEHVGAHTRSGERAPLRQIIRDELDDADPRRVLFERALAERGMSPTGLPRDY